MTKYAPLSDNLVSEGRRLKALIYGASGVGKTVFAASFPRPFFFDLEGGLLSVETGIRHGWIDKKPEEIYSVRIEKGKDPRTDKSFDVLCAEIDNVLEAEEKGDLPTIDTFIFDSFSAWNASVLLKALKEAKKFGISKSLDKLTSSGAIPTTQSDFRIAIQMTERLLDFLLELDKNVIFLAHEWYERSDSGSIKGIKPLLHGQLRERLPAMLDEVYRMEITPKKKRVLRTVGTNMFPSKSRLGCFDPTEPADFISLRNKAAKFFDADPAKLWVK